MKGSYCLVIDIPRDIKQRIGKMGKLSFKKGLYIYVGSAMNNIEKRVERHIKTSKGRNKILFWHIDYLLSNRNVKIRDIYIRESHRKEECIVAEKLLSHGGTPTIKKFGSSDCSCKSHLFRVKEVPDFILKDFHPYKVDCDEEETEIILKG